MKSSSRAKDCPRDTRPEFAMLGRSNVGKSSLINALCRKKEVALTSKKPGSVRFSVPVTCLMFCSSGVFVDVVFLLCREDSAD